MTFWKLTPAARLEARSYAARIEKKAPGQIYMRIGQRYHLETGARHDNILRLTADPDWSDTDLDDMRDWSEWTGTETTDDGRAVVDIYVYDRRDGELLTNIQLHAAPDPATGKPTLWKLTGTMAARVILRPDIYAKQRHHPIGVDG